MGGRTARHHTGILSPGGCAVAGSSMFGWKAVMLPELLCPAVRADSSQAYSARAGSSVVYSTTRLRIRLYHHRSTEVLRSHKQESSPWLSIIS